MYTDLSAEAKLQVPRRLCSALLCSALLCSLPCYPNRYETITTAERQACLNHHCSRRRRRALWTSVSQGASEPLRTRAPPILPISWCARIPRLPRGTEPRLRQLKRAPVGVSKSHSTKCASSSSKSVLRDKR